MDFFDLIIGFFLLGISLFLGSSLPFNQVGLGVFIVTFTLASIFIYEGATELAARREAITRDEAGPNGPRTQLDKVVYAPTTELFVHEVIEQDQTAFFEDIIRHMSASSARVEPIVDWVDGFALLASRFPPTDEVVAGNLAGKIHYQTIAFTRMPFHSKVNMKLEDQDFSVRLRKADNNRNLADLAAFLKRFKPRTPSHVSDPPAVQYQFSIPSSSLDANTKVLGNRLGLKRIATPTVRVHTGRVVGRGQSGKASRGHSA